MNPFDSRPLIVTAIALCGAVVACAPSPRPETAPPSGPLSSNDSGSRAPLESPAPPASGAPPTAGEDAGPPPPPPPAASAAADASAATPVKTNVKIVTIGMHVAGGPYDEPTKQPFKKAVEPHFPEIAQCWGKHVPNPPKQVDVGVDLLIEASGGRPKVGNPRSTVKGSEVEGFVPCVVAVFEGVEFPKLDRGRTGVSYSLRFSR